MRPGDSFWPVAETDAAQKNIHATRSLVTAAVKLLDKDNLRQWQREDRLNAEELITGLEVEFFLVASDVTITQTEQSLLLKTPTKSETYNAYIEWCRELKSVAGDMPIAMSVKWPGWKRYVIWHPDILPAARMRLPHLRIPLRGQMFILQPLEGVLGVTA